MDRQDLYYKYSESEGFPKLPEQDKNTESAPTSVRKKRSAKQLAGMITAFVLALALVGFGSVGAYVLATGGASPNQTSSTNVVWNAAGGGVSETANTASGASVVQADNSGRTEMTTEDIYANYVDSVVEITAEYTYMNQTGAAGGSGVVMSSDGYIVTNAHIVANTVKLGGTVKVLFYDGRELEAKIIGSDTTSDIAVVKVVASDLTAALFGDSDTVKVGQRAVAIGNPLTSELTFTTTQGIISAINRNITISGRQMTLLQTDAAINSGNSGGPLFNKYGEVIGITSAKIMSSVYSGTTAEGIGFAIPSNTAMTIASELMSNGFVSGRPLVGISGTSVTDEMASTYNVPRGVYVQFITEGTPAESSGIKSGDIITKFNGVDMTSRDDLVAERDKLKAGDSVPVTVWRDGQTLELTLTLGQNTES